MNDISIRPLELDDRRRLAELYRHDREFLKHWDPERPDAFYTDKGQADAIAATLRECASGRMWSGVILEAGNPVGRVNLNGILGGPLRSCFLGYWVAQPYSGRGVATEAVRQALEVAFGPLGIHRTDAFARQDNPGSCRVLQKNGFRRVRRREGTSTSTVGGVTTSCFRSSLHGMTVFFSSRPTGDLHRAQR